MEVEHEMEKMTLNECLEYKVKKERRAFDYPYYHEDIKIKKYYELPPLLHCFQPAQPYTEAGLVSSNESNEVDINSMTIAEHKLYIAKQELSFEEDITVEDVERLRQLLTPTVHTLPEPDPVVQLCVPLIPIPDEVKVLREKEPDNVINCIFIQVPDIMNDVIQPLIPQTIHTTPPDKDYVAPATKPILDEILEEFGDEILNISMVDEEADFNPTRDIEELERLIVTNHESLWQGDGISRSPCLVVTWKILVVDCNYGVVIHLDYAVVNLKYRMIDQFFEFGIWMLLDEAFLEHAIDQS
ncbi:hypothetical protein Tco_0656103 [Tanacetum coccineum]|uniref:Uncharacterized protein n=1 Tax=Tanacetum coccineum TaxID=301880 RepID=A0ABQ4X7X1_9ASTR